MAADTGSIGGSVREFHVLKPTPGEDAIAFLPAVTMRRISSSPRRLRHSAAATPTRAMEIDTERKDHRRTGRTVRPTDRAHHQDLIVVAAEGVEPGLVALLLRGVIMS